MSFPRKRESKKELILMWIPAFAGMTKKDKMIDILRRKLAEKLNDAAHKGLARIDKNSPLAEELKKYDVEGILKADIEKICNNVSFFEMTRVMALMVQLKSEVKRQGAMKPQLKAMVQKLIDRIERDAGKLQTPMSCREILFNL